MEGGSPTREHAAGVTGWGILITLLHHARQTVTVRETMTKVNSRCKRTRDKRRARSIRGGSSRCAMGDESRKSLAIARPRAGVAAERFAEWLGNFWKRMLLVQSTKIRTPKIDRLSRPAH